MKTKYKIFFARQIYRILSLFFSNNFIFKRKNIYWNIDLSEAIDLHIFLFGSFEREIKDTADKLEYKDYKTILDIGANFGVQALQFADNFRDAKIFAIEPTKYAFDKMKKNLKLNPQLSKNIHIDQAFLSSNEKKIPPSVYSSWDLKSIDEQHPKHKGFKKDTINSNIFTLDEYVNSNKIENVDFIKLDVDGSELNVLKGGENFLKKCKPPIFMELAPYLYKEFGYNINDLINFLVSIDYKFYDIKKIKLIEDIGRYSENIKDGSSKNILIY